MTPPWSGGPVPDDAMECRVGCAACCIALSISSPIPGMPFGKPAGMPCVQLTPDGRCALFGMPERPAVCTSLRPMRSMCGATREEALAILEELESQTAPRRNFIVRQGAATGIPIPEHAPYRTFDIRRFGQR